MLVNCRKTSIMSSIFEYDFAFAFYGEFVVFIDTVFVFRPCQKRSL